MDTRLTVLGFVQSFRHWRRITFAGCCIENGLRWEKSTTSLRPNQAIVKRRTYPLRAAEQPEATKVISECVSRAGKKTIRNPSVKELNVLKSSAKKFVKSSHPRQNSWAVTGTKADEQRDVADFPTSM